MSASKQSSNQDSSAQKALPSYLTRLNAKPSNRKVGQSFVTTIKNQEPIQARSQLQEKIIQDIMRNRKVDRKTAEAIFDNPF